MISEISTLFGLKVYTDEGRYVGKVDDVVIDLEKRQVRGLALGDYNKVLIDSKAPGIIIPYRLVKSVGDIVLIKDIFKFSRKKVRREERYEGEEEAITVIS
ncbi:MAG TPA: photosystem reaction center subunit H [Archaeoglobaceae archaeon]|nr:photosystem reaction center subunit H [Archaeoglobaceae archaeon]